MPKSKAPAADAAADSLVPVRVLSDCAHGLCGQVVDVPASVATSSPQLDPHPEAVAYARSVLAQAAERDAPDAEQRG
jgi:hypothetical protein